MSDDYDSVTQKRRPVISVIFVSLLAMFIFGASASAASVDELFTSDTLATSLTGNVEEVRGPNALEVEAAEAPEPEPEPESTEPAALDPGAELPNSDELLADLQDRVLSTRDAQADLAAPIDPGEIPPVEELLAEAAAEQDAAAVAAAAVAEAEQAALVATELAAETEAIAAEAAAAAEAAEAEAQAAAAAQAEAEAAAAAEEQDAVVTTPLTGTATQQAVQLSSQLGNPSNEADAQAAWDRGYILGGGGNLSAFHSTILPCESGSQANRDTVVGATDDWGRAQVNRPVWSSTFANMFGIAFETGITQPVLNGYMAAYIEDVQGLSAWTCWRNR